jgi:hypothetical protein
MCLCVNGLVVHSVLKEVTHYRLVDKICSSGKTSELFLELNIYNISKTTDYSDVGFMWLYSDPPGKCSYCTSKQAQVHLLVSPFRSTECCHSLIPSDTTRT